VFKYSLEVNPYKGKYFSAVAGNVLESIGCIGKNSNLGFIEAVQQCY